MKLAIATVAVLVCLCGMKGIQASGYGYSGYGSGYGGGYGGSNLGYGGYGGYGGYSGYGKKEYSGYGKKDGGYESIIDEKVIHVPYPVHVPVSTGIGAGAGVGGGFGGGLFGGGSELLLLLFLLPLLLRDSNGNPLFGK